MCAWNPSLAARKPLWLQSRPQRSSYPKLGSSSKQLCRITLCESSRLPGIACGLQNLSSGTSGKVSGGSGELAASLVVETVDTSH